MPTTENSGSTVDVLKMIVGHRGGERMASVGSLAGWSGRGESAVYGWIEYGVEPKHHDIHLIGLHSHNTQIRLLLARAFLRGWNLDVREATAESAAPTPEALKTECLDLFQEVSQAVEEIRRDLADGRYTAAEAVTTHSKLDTVANALQGIRQTVDKMAEADAKKRITGPRGLTG